MSIDAIPIASSGGADKLLGDIIAPLVNGRCYHVIVPEQQALIMPYVVIQRREESTEQVYSGANGLAVADFFVLLYDNRDKLKSLKSLKTKIVQAIDASSWTTITQHAEDYDEEADVYGFGLGVTVHEMQT